jgi:hypothetical protein
MSKKKKTKVSLPPEKVVEKIILEGFFKDNYLYIFIGIIIVGAFLRLNHLTADPPFNLSYSLGPFTDEGAIAISARNKLFWGSWKMDDFFRMSISSLLSFIYFIIFRIAGTGFAQIRIVPIAASLGTIFLVFSILKKEGNIKAAIFSSLFLSFSYFYVMHNRLALEETSLIFFLVLSIYFLLKGKDNKTYFLFSGLALSAGIFFIKVSGIFFIPLLIFEILRWGFIREKPRMKKMGEFLLYFLAGLAGGFLIWLLLIVLPYKSTVINYILFHTLRSEAGKAQNLGKLIKNLNSLGTSSKFFAQMFFLFVFSFVYIIYWLRNIKEKIRVKSSLEFISILWIIIGMLFLAYPNYQPIRYRLVLVPPMGILAGFLISKIAETSELKFSGKIRLFGLVLGFGVLVVFIYNLYFSIFLYVLENYRSFMGIVSWFSTDPLNWFRDMYRFINDYSSLINRSLILAMVITGILLVISLIPRLKQGFRFPKSLRFIIVVLVIFLSIFSDLKQYSAWSGNVTYDLIDISRDLNNLPKGSVIAGPWVATLSLENKHRAILMLEFANREKIIERFHPTHLIIFKDGWEDVYFHETYPELMSKAILLKEYSIHTPYNKPLLLYELPKE